MRSLSPVRALIGAVSTALVVVAGTAAPATAIEPTGKNWPELEKRLQVVVDDAAAAGITLGVTVKDLSVYKGAVAQAGAHDQKMKAASIIKLGLLSLLMSRVDKGTLSLDTMISIPAGSANIVGGSGTLRTRSFPLTISIRELMQLTVQVSDNTATNVLIDVAGGFDAVNTYLRSLGFTTLYLGRKMISPASPPLKENYINADEVVSLLEMLWKGTILSRSSSDHIINLMRGQLVNTKYGAVIPRQFLANKTGELGDVSHDSGYILLPGREVAMATTTSYSSTIPQTQVNVYVQRTATIVYDYLHEPLPGDNGNRPPVSYEIGRPAA
ncbi:MAG: serine hydrolase [Frankiales bacterium]|nr:serine hydrolase [Frankiales bacterium]